jgi:hypothetical protein
LTNNAEVIHDWAVAGRGVGLKVQWDIQDAKQTTQLPWPPRPLQANISDRREFLSQSLPQTRHDSVGRRRGTSARLLPGVPVSATRMSGTGY